MNVIRAKQIPRKPLEIEDILARFCLYYPQYKFHEARKLPYKRIVQMMHVADKDYARRMIDLVQIVAAPHTKKGTGVSKLISIFEKILKD